MDNRKRTTSSSNSGNLVFWSSSFQWQPARVLIVETLPPWWPETSTALCDALDNFLCLACSLDGPCRIPLLSVYAISRQQECLLPFVQVRGNFARLHSCVEELRSIPGEGCNRGAARQNAVLRQAVLDSLQQFKEYIRHTSTGKQASNTSVECLMLGTEVDLQRVENSVFAMENMLKTWLREHGGDREHLHLLLPSPLDNPIPVCVKCDMQERLISPALIPLTPNLGLKTESVRDFLPLAKGSANQSPPIQRLKVVRVLHADGVCESVLYGLPLVIRPTTCWKLDWDEMESNHNLFHALCYTLRSRDLFLLLQVEPIQRSAAKSSGVYSHYVLQPSPSLSFLLKPVASREFLLPCSLPVSSQRPAPDAMQTVQECLTQLDEEFVFNPLSLSCNLYQHLRSRGLLLQPRYPYRLQPAVDHGDRPQAAEGPKPTGSRQLRQAQNQGRQMGTNRRVRATVAPLPSTSSYSSSMGPPPAKASRPALTLLSSSSRSHKAPAPSPPEKDDGDSDSIVID
ncbi:hypothetical protein Q5P01_002309 [Channa striata]|uniref:Meiosis 1 arrest protein n=1 Tax=Channa striata TaxID=64152 RepID=A0AA88NM94_CHASR|nr:hypothetical protein Q5P01_002309 [Channa striata]